MYKNILFLILLQIPVMLWAQPKDNSPYSRFGIGDIVNRNFYSTESMGSLGASFYDPYQINIVNPASLSYLTATSFDLGVFAEYSSLRDGAGPDTAPSPYSSLWNGNLGYLSLAIPLQNKLNDLLDRKKRDFSMTTAFTLMPYSTVGYNIKIDEFDDDIGEIKKRFEGSGGTYQFMWSNGARYKDFSFGLNLGYFFGKIDYSRTLQFDTGQPFFNTLFTQSNRLSGFLWDLGVMYVHTFNQEQYDKRETEHLKKMSFGLHGTSKTSFNTTSSTFEGAVQSGTAIIDTLVDGSLVPVESSGSLPSEIGLGATYYHGEKFALGFNYSTTQWSQFDAIFVNNSLNDITKLSFGGFYRPNYKSINSYFSRVYYRFGFYYNQVPNEIPENGTESINDFGINFGMGLPFFYQRKISHANLGVNLGWRGRGTAVEERYLRFTFSFTFNDDEWFLKRKYN